MNCSKCGNELAPGSAFCDACGNSVDQTENITLNHFAQQPKEAVSVWGYIGRSLITLIPFVGSIIYFIMLFVWGGDSSKEDSFRNWAKAQLWLMLISAIISAFVIFVCFLVYGAAFLGIIGSALAENFASMG